MSRLALFRLPAALWIIAAELAARYAGQAWGFTVILAAFAWLAAVTRLGAATQAGTQAAAAHNRIDTLVPQVASAQTTATSAQTTANSAHTTATSAQATANSAQTAVSRLTGATTGQPNVTGGSAYTSDAVNCPTPNGTGDVYFDGSVTWTGTAQSHQHGMGHTHGIIHNHGYAHTHQLPG